MPADSQRNGDEDQQQAQLDVDFLAVEKVDRLIFQIWIGQDPVQIKERRCAVGGEVE